MYVVFATILALHRGFFSGTSGLPLLALQKNQHFQIPIHSSGSSILNIMRLGKEKNGSNCDN